MSTNATVAAVIAEAKSHLGYKESPANSNNTMFGQWYGANYQPWCAMFVSYCEYVCGNQLDITTPKGFAYTPYGVDYFKKNKAWFPSTQSQPGDLIFFDWSGNGEADHVGLVVEGWNGQYTVTIEGNTSSSDGSQNNGGEVAMHNRDAGPTTLGVGRPKYANTKPSPTPVVTSYPAWPGVTLIVASPPHKSNEALTWQNQMKNRGWTIAPDGYYGPQSENVCKQFQKQKGLTVDGQVGPVTWRAAWTAPQTKN